MAKTIGIVGGFTGKLGNAVGYIRQGTQLMRVYQPNVTNPRTLRQEVSRKNFVVSTELARSFGIAPLIGYNKVAPSYERQAMVGELIRGEAVSTSDQLVSEIDYAGVLVSAGSLPPLPKVTPTVGEPGSVSIPVTSGLIPVEAFYIDGVTPINVLVFGVVFNPKDGTSRTQVIGVYTSPDAAGTGVAPVVVPAAWSGEACHVYTFYKQSPTPLNGVPIEQLPPRIRFQGCASTYCGTVTLS